MTSKELGKFLKHKKLYGSVRRYLCQVSFEAESDGGGLYDIMWYGTKGYKDFTNKECLKESYNKDME